MKFLIRNSPLIFTITLLYLNILVVAQQQIKTDDFGRVCINSYLPENTKIPVEAKSFLETKLNQIVTNSGVANSEVNPRFIITANPNISTKDIIAGPPQMVAVNIELTFFIGDAIENKKFTSVTLSLKGVGNNENKAFIDAIKKINVNDERLKNFVNQGKEKIVSYYETQCDFIIREAVSLKKQGLYDEAIYKLALVPDVCKMCYFKCKENLESIFQEKVDKECQTKLREAKAIWASKQDSKAAEAAGDIINTVSPFAACTKEINQLMSSITSKLKEDARKAWEFKVKKYNDQLEAKKEAMKRADANTTREYELDKLRINSYREIAVEQAKHQPSTVNYYTKINWWD